jgi:hypothetical protein
MITAQQCGTSVLHDVVSSANTLPAIVYRTRCGQPVPAGSWGVYELTRGQKTNCEKCQSVKEPTMTTMEVRDTEAPPANGETTHDDHEKPNGRKARTALETAAAFLARQRSTEDARAKLADALRAEINERAVMLAELEGAPAAESKKDSAPLRKPAKSPKPGPRGPRAESVPSRVLAYLKDSGPAGASQLATYLNLDPRVIHGALHNLLKAWKVKSKGERKNRVWSVR